MAIAARLRRRFETRLAAWVKRRQGGDALPVLVHRRRLYILPTRAGVGFALLLFGMLLAGLNYANSLALFMTFLLAGLALAAMHFCHGNLLGARIVGARVEPAFAGEDALLELVIDTGTVRRHEYCIAPGGAARDDASPPVHAGPGERAALQLALPGRARGVHAVERIRLATSWPFGLFRAWTWLHLPLEQVVYPAARGTLALVQAAGGGRRATGDGREAGDDEWRGLREYREGDPPRRIAWKAYARGAALLVGDYAAAGDDTHEFDFDRLAPLDLEARLEQLCRWIVAAEQRGEPYALRLPRESIAAGSGAAHRHRCLAALARMPS
ncbi:MAG: DUF58 domain-containing protein [Steroidobacteraceae bacterium]